MIRLLLLIGALAAGAWMPLSARGATIMQNQGNAWVSFEAETHAGFNNGTQTFWVSTNDAAASGSTALYIGGTTDNGTSPHSFVQYQIKFSSPGTYNLYYRWKADSARTVADQFTGNSCWIPNDFGSLSKPGAEAQPDFHTAAANGTQAPANNVYDWQREADTATYTVTAAQVSAGVPLVLTIGTREAGMTIDRWVLSPDATLTDAALDGLALSETSEVNQGKNEPFVAFEAETKGTLINATQTFWVSTNDATASGTAALYIGGTTDNGTSPHSLVQYQIKFSSPGTYNLYYRWKADSARTVADQFTANSCWIPNDFGSLNKPGAEAQADFHTSASNGTQAPGNNAYDWQREGDTATYTVTASQISAGVPLVLTIGTREAGMIIDRWVLSPDANLTDAALDALPNSGAGAAGPEIVKAVGSASLNTVRIQFTKALNPTSVSPLKFGLNGGLTVTAATLDPDDPRQVLLTSSSQTQGTLYTVTVNDVSDTTGSTVAPNTQKNFTAWRLAEGWTTTEIFLNVTGQTVEELKASPGYQAGKPDEVRWVKGFQLNNDPRAPNMGARLSALLKPETAGAYKFYINNDNEAELLLSTDQTDANLQSLGVFPLSPNVFDENLTATSPTLAAGQNYLLTGLIKTDGGDVYLNVAAQPASSSAAAATLPVLGGGRISSYVNPDLGNVTFTEQPAATSAVQGDRARFSVKTETTESPVYYQWQVNGADISGATRRTYITPPLTAADSGKQYRVVVSVAGKDTPSESAAVTVSAGDPSNLLPYLGINFVGGGDSLPGPLTTVDVAGVVPQENWNNLTGSTFEQTGLNDASGASTAVTLTAQATEHWYSGTLGAGDANGVMLQGFLSTGASTDPFSITLNNVPSGNYNLIVYSVGFPFQASYEEAISLTGAAPYPTLHVKAESGLEYNASPAFRRMTSTDPNSRSVGNYVQFDNVSPAADGSFVLATSWESTNAGNTHQPAVNAIQLVKVGAVTQRPAVAVVRQGANLTLSWGSAATGFILQTSSVLGAGASWLPVTGAPNPLTGAGSIDIALSGNGGFYRLQKAN